MRSVIDGGTVLLRCFVMSLVLRLVLVGGIRLAAREDGDAVARALNLRHRSRDTGVVKLDVKFVGTGGVGPTVFPDLLKVAVRAAAIRLAVIGGPPWSPEHNLDLSLGRAAHLNFGGLLGGAAPL